MKCWLLLFLALLLGLSSSGFCGEPTIPQRALKVAEGYKYLREKNNDNKEPEITEWLKYAGLGPGYPYCQAYVNYCYKKAYEEIGLKSPLSKSASVAQFAKWSLNHPLTVKVIPIKTVLMGYNLEAGDIISWKHGKALFKESFSYNGHAGILKLQRGNNLFLTIEANTKPSNLGDQTGRTIGDTKYGHDGVYYKERTAGNGGNFPILFFIRVTN